jgi:DNA-binding NarL/FixJ family response regulator
MPGHPGAIVAAKRRPRGIDSIAIVETIYDLSLSQDDWLRHVSRAILRDRDATLGSLTVQFTRQHDGSYAVRPLYVDTPPQIEESFPVVMAPVIEANSVILPMMVGEPLHGLIETFPAGHPYRAMCEQHLARVGGVDTNLVVACDTAAHLVSISPLFTREATPTSSVREKYRRLAAHFSSAIRLRRRLTKDRDPEPHAVFDPAGKSRHARGQASERDALQALRLAVRNREKARTKRRRSDADEPLRLWKAMVSGRWSLLDRFESDGRRFVVAMENENVPSDPRALTPREEQAAQLAGCGASNGRIAYALGVTAECVSAHLHAALRKLRCASRRDLIRMMSQSNYEFTTDIHGEMIGVLAEPPAAHESPESLTPAERRVLVAVREGKTNAGIAAQLGTSARTVANQIASILRKTRVSSRYELMLDSSGGKRRQAPQRR